MKAKIIASLTVFTLLFTLCAAGVYAAEPGFTYEAVKNAGTVTIDGLNSPGEWDDANTLVCNSESEIFKNFGRWQGAEGNETYGPDKLNVTYRVKWDDQYLYILEERFDTVYFFPADKTATEPWCGDGTLFFLAYDNGDTKWANAYEPFWVNKGGPADKAMAAVRTWVDGSFVQLEGDDIKNWTFAGTHKDNVYTTELRIPWADMQSVGAFTAAEGLKFWMTPIIANQSTSDSFGTDWNQLNFHDRGNRDDANLDEGGNPAEFPVNWGRMVLAAAKPAATDAPATEDSTPAPVTSAKTTDISVVMSLLAAVSALGSAVVFRKKK